jgi:primosomal protein N'
MYAHIIPLTRIPLAKPQIYTYESGDLASDIKIGQVVEAPLYNRSVLGIVSGVAQTAPGNIKYKTLTKIIDPYPIVSERELRLAQFISDYYYSSLGLVLKQLTPELPRRKMKKLTENLAKLNLSVIARERSDRGNPVNSSETVSSLLAVTPRNDINLIIDSQVKRLKQYQELIAQNLQQKKQILFLVPETILLAQMENWLKQNFPNQPIVLLQSDSSMAAQLLSWRQAQTGGAKIFLGTRRAIFTPFYNLGQIIIDDEQSQSYKQWDMNPRYDARIVAEQKTKIYGCILTLGASAPTVNACFNFKISNEGDIPECRLQNVHPNIIDMRAQLRGGNYSIFSDHLQNALNRILTAKKQALIFVNRRGESTFVMCRDCGAILRCPRCKTPLMEHTAKILSCVHCSTKMASPAICPSCRSPRIKGFGVGVEKVEMELKKIFPTAKISRLDSGTASPAKNVKARYAEFAAGNIDILIGTQIVLPIIAPNLELAAAINIDSILNFPGWQTDERAWHILLQIAGRDDLKEKIIQTYNPDNKLLQYIVRGQFAEFYRQELEQRKQFGYPPFARLIKLICKSDDYDYLTRESLRVADKLKLELTGQKIIGPLKPTPEKIRDFWQREIIIKLAPLNCDGTAATEVKPADYLTGIELNYKNDKLKNILRDLTNEWNIDVDPLT